MIGAKGQDEIVDIMNRRDKEVFRKADIWQ